MTRITRYRQCLSVVVLSVLTTPLQAQSAEASGTGLSWLPAWSLFVPHLGSWSGSVGLGFAHSEQSVSSGAASSGSNSNDLGETLSVSNSGIYVLSPLLFTGSLGVSLDLNQSKSSGDGDGASSAGKGLGYSFSGTVLSGKPYPIDLSANRNQVQLTQSSGARVRGTIQNRRITFSLHPDSVLNDMGYPWTEGALELAQDHEQTTTTTFGRDTITDQTTKSFNFQALKGFETADLAFKYNRNEQQNLTRGLAAARSRFADLSYSLDFGPTLNRRLDTRLNYQARADQTVSDTLSADAQLQWDHSQNLNSSYGWMVTQQDTQQPGAALLRSTSQTLTAGVTHQLYKNLRTSLQISDSHTQQVSGTTQAQSGQFSQAYTHSVPGGGTFSTNWSAGYQIDRNALSNGDITVVSEPHSAPVPLAFGEGFDLSQRFVVRSTISVRNNIGVPLVEGTDYVVVDSLLDSKKTRIEPLPTSLTIAAGEALLVNYVYQVDPTLSSRTQSRSLGLALSYPWGTVAVGRSSSQAEPVDLSEKSASSPFLQSSDQRFVQFGTNYELWGMTASTQVNYTLSESVNDRNNQLKIDGDLARSLDSETQATIAWQASQSRYQMPTVRTSRGLSVQGAYRQPGRSLTLSVAARQSINIAPDASTDQTLTANGSYNWISEGDWNNTVGIDLSRQKQRNNPAQLLMQIRGQRSVTMGKLTLSLNGNFGRWLSGNQRSVNKSFNVAATRSF